MQLLCCALLAGVVQVWAYPTTAMQCDWLGERVATVDAQRAIKNVVDGKEDAGWGPNAVFRSAFRVASTSIIVLTLPYHVGAEFWKVPSVSGISWQQSSCLSFASRLDIAAEIPADPSLVPMEVAQISLLQCIAVEMV